MSLENYITVAHVRNESAKEMRIYLEMVSAEIVLSPGHAVELLAQPSDGLLPVTLDYMECGLQVHPHKEFDPDWHVRFKGRLVRAGHPTILSEYE